MSAFINMVVDPIAAKSADELRRTWHAIERAPPNNLRIAIFYEQMEMYLIDFGSQSPGGEEWDRRP